jgi:hypothetical protein
MDDLDAGRMHGRGMPLEMTDFPLAGGCNCGAVRFG